MKLSYIFTFCIFYLFGFIACFIISVVISVLEEKTLYKSCGLFVEVESEEIWKSSTAYGICEWLMFLPCFIVVFSFGMFIYYLHPTVRILKRESISCTVWTKPFLPATVVIWVLLLINCCIVSVGFANTCSSAKHVYYRTNCEKNLAEIFWTSRPNRKDKDMFRLLVLMLVCTWMAFISYTVIVILSVLRVIKSWKTPSSSMTEISIIYV